jgi:signal transduction histidine kinase
LMHWCREFVIGKNWICVTHLEGIVISPSVRGLMPKPSGIWSKRCYPIVTLDQQKFKQVLYNLLSNAAKFTDNGGKVEIHVAMYDAYRLKLSVRDTGIGIKTEDLPRLFKEFEQLGTGVARRYEGTGLGLVLTRKIVELHGGTIGVEGEIGKGSNFTVVLPLVLAHV